MKQGVLLLDNIDVLDNGGFDDRLGLEILLDILSELDRGHTLAVGASEVY